eukprot:1223837-Amphidinium_carterae.1
MTIAANLPRAHLRKSIKSGVILERKNAAPKKEPKFSDWAGDPGQARCLRLVSKAGIPGPNHDMNLSETRPAEYTVVHYQGPIHTMPGSSPANISSVSRLPISNTFQGTASWSLIWCPAEGDGGTS